MMKRGVDPGKLLQWSRRLKQFRKTSLNVAEFCRREGVSVPSFYYWRRRLAAGSLAKPVKPARRSSMTRARLSSERNGDTRCFKRLEIIAGGSRQSHSPGVTVRMPGGIEIDLGKDLSVIGQVVSQLLDHEATGGERC